MLLAFYPVFFISKQTPSYPAINIIIMFINFSHAYGCKYLLNYIYNY